MNTARPFRLRALWLVVFGLACGVSGRTTAAEAVVNAQVPEQQVSTGDLRAIFTLRKRAWRDGTPIRLFVLPDNNELHQKFAKQQLRLYPYQLRQIWDRAVFSGTGAAPALVGDAEEMLKAVGETPGAIGYTESAILPPSVRPAGAAP
ncbi:MAG: hypothetical protein ACRETN_13365 [Nevskiales bacterium]